MGKRTIRIELGEKDMENVQRFQRTRATAKRIIQIELCEKDMEYVQRLACTWNVPIATVVQVAVRELIEQLE